MSKKITLIVLDGVGTGNAPDAIDFGDLGADTLGSVLNEFPDIELPNLGSMGLFHMRNKYNNDDFDLPELVGSYGVLSEQSKGKDTTIGHWEIAGIITPKAFPVYPDGFPKDLLDKFTALTGYEVIGNKPESGTVIIKELGQEHLETGKLIVYTSADSVFQIAAHDSIVDIDTLYDICRKTRTLLVGEHAMARVIARPFTGEYPDYVRTADRKDFSLEPTSDTMLNVIDRAGMPSVGVGKIEDIFTGSGINRAIHSHGNPDCMEATLDEIQKDYSGLLFVNLVDTDMLYGHRNDIEGFANSLKATDEYIGKYMELMDDDDILMITADHGVDPGFEGTDHTRELVPLLVYSKNLKSGVDLGKGDTYADIAASCLDYLDLEQGEVQGTSFMDKLVK